MEQAEVRRLRELEKGENARPQTPPGRTRCRDRRPQGVLPQKKSRPAGTPGSGRLSGTTRRHGPACTAGSWVSPDAGRNYQSRRKEHDVIQDLKQLASPLSAVRLSPAASDAAAAKVPMARPSTLNGCGGCGTPAGLKLPVKRRKKAAGASGVKQPVIAAYPNHVWAYDFLHDWCLERPPAQDPHGGKTSSRRVPGPMKSTTASRPGSCAGFSRA